MSFGSFVFERTIICSVAFFKCALEMEIHEAGSTWSSAMAENAQICVGDQRV